MKIIIKDLDKQAHDEIVKCIGIYGEVQHYSPQSEIYDVRLDESVIVKTHFDSVTLDLGGKLATIEQDEFGIIEIY